MSDETGRRWSAETDRVLRAAGWYPGRSVPTTEWERILHKHDGFEIHEAARRFLTEFGGLASLDRGPGKTMARLGFRLDPLAAQRDHEIFEVLSEEAYLYPIGEADRRNSYLGIAPNGAVYIGMDSVTLLADTGDEALEKLIEGIR
jgi:hypothetical protein